MTARIFPFSLIVGGITAAAYFAVDEAALEFAVACMAVAIGVFEWNATELHEQDAERFER